MTTKHDTASATTTVLEERYNLPRPLIAKRVVRNQGGETGTITLKMFKVIETEYADITSEGIVNDPTYYRELVRHSIEMCQSALRTHSASHEQLSSLLSNLEWSMSRTANR